MKEKALKFVVLVIIVLLILNMILLALGKIDILLFWIIILLAGISSYTIKKFIKK